MKLIINCFGVLRTTLRATRVCVSKYIMALMTMMMVLVVRMQLIGVKAASLVALTISIIMDMTLMIVAANVPVGFQT